jgi:hypothetical protein
MKVRLYNFSKRNKSTKIPDSSVSYRPLDNVRLKEATSKTKPVFLFQTIDSGYNYLYVEEWARYYFISDVTSVESMWEVACTEDYLGSFRAAIGNSVAMIMYATGSDKNIVDQRIPVQANFIRTHNSTPVKNAQGTTVLFDNAYCAVIGITGVGSMGQYLLESPLILNELLDGVDNWKATSLQDMVSIGQQLFYGGSASECLKSAIGLPFVVPISILGTLQNIYLGNYPCKDSNNNNIKGYSIKNGTFTYDTDISIPWSSTDWLTVSQYTSISMYIPLCGLVSLPATDLKKDSTLTVTYSVNPSSGEFGVKVVGKTSGVCVYTGSGSCAFNLPYGSTGYNMDKLNTSAVAGIGTALAATAGAVATGGASVAAELAVGGAIAGVVSGTLGALAGNPSGSAGGGGSASLGLGTNIEIWVTQKILTDSQPNLDELIGKPYMGKSLISNFSGYIQTDGFQFADIRAYSSEKDMINRLLDSGIYYE